MGLPRPARVSNPNSFKSRLVVPEALQDEYDVWRVWQSERATYQELDSWWSIVDLYKAIIALELEDAVNHEHSRFMETQRRRN